ncbi:MAG: glycosyltransferase family 39 protein [Candidatus ainarchaeum sp.]|nr:glycosyltransferase family 39 protein [Candidatus ainarchaeum sp.]MDD5096223.1 glycosyltransferase family 39 protein [Candidatus ainarchaeum sp.]
MFRKIILALFTIVFISKFAYLGAMPFSFDETLYTEMIAEEAEHPSFLPTWFGYPAPWKPGLFFFASSLFLPITSAIFSSPEYAYRIPLMVFGLLNAALLYLIIKRFSGEGTALAASLIFYSALPSFSVESRLLMETFMLSTILASLYFYTREKPGPSNFILGGIFAFLAAITKSVVALLIPALAIAYVFQFDRKSLRSPAFLISLLAVPAGLALFWLSLSGLGLSESIFFTDTGKMFVYDYSSELLSNVVWGATLILLFMLPVLAASLISFASTWRKNLMFSAWMLLLFFLLLLGQRPWYYYYAMPPVAFFSALLLVPSGKKLDAFAALILAILAAVSCSVALFTEWNPSYIPSFGEGKEIGLMLSGKENVLFIGQYQVNTISISYKSIEERRDYGNPLDFGWILFDYRKNNLTSASAQDFVQDYWRADYDVEESDFAAIFWQDRIFRKNTSITEFDYVVVSPPIENFTPAGYSRYYAGNYSTVYGRIG